MPFELKIPNHATKAAMHELEQEGGKAFASFQDMIDDLDNDDA